MVVRLPRMALRLRGLGVSRQAVWLGVSVLAWLSGRHWFWPLSIRVGPPRLWGFELALRFGRFGPGAVIERDGDTVTHRLPPGVEAIDVAALGF